MSCDGIFIADRMLSRAEHVVLCMYEEFKTKTMNDEFRERKR